MVEVIVTKPTSTETSTTTTTTTKGITTLISQQDADTPTFSKKSTATTATGNHYLTSFSVRNN